MIPATPAAELMSERLHARALGIALRVSADQDRPEGYGRDPRGRLACPTCEDGLVTILTPRRCRECAKGGL
jgi:hypothetical protein